MKRSPNRGIVLALHHAVAIHRMLEFWLDDRRFDNPIVAFETKHDCEEAKQALGEKLMAVFLAHHDSDDEAQSVTQLAPEDQPGKP